MATIVTRASKPSALTTQEMDDNFINLKTEVEQATSDILAIDVDGKLDAANGTATGTLNTENITATGDIQADNLINTDLKGYGEVMLTTSPATGAISLDLSAANIFRLDLTGNATVTFTNPPAAGSTSVATIIAIQDVSGGHSITWTGGAYAGGTPPPASTGSNKVDIWTVFTYDQGTSYVVSLSMKDVS
jgi:hypothetical protein